MTPKMKAALKGYRPGSHDDLMSAIQATGEYLQSLTNVGAISAAKNDAAKNRCRHLSSLILKIKFCSSSAASVVNAIHAMHAPSMCKDALIAQVADKVIADGCAEDADEGADEEAAVAIGNNQQCFMNIVNYLTSDQWGSTDFEQEMVSTACQLGLKNPTEDTCAVMAAAAEAQANGVDQARKVRFIPLYDHVQSIKKAIKTEAEFLCMKGSALNIKVLPKTPDQLLLKHPEVYRRGIHGRVITPMPYDKLSFEALVNRVPRRSSHAGYRAEMKAANLNANAIVPGNWMQSSTAMLPANMMDQQMQQVILRQQMQLQEMQMQLMRMKTQPNGAPADDEDIPGLQIFSRDAWIGSQSSGPQIPALQDRPAVRQQPAEAFAGPQAAQQGSQLSNGDGRVPDNSSVPNDSSITLPEISGRNSGSKRKSVAETTQMLLAGLKKPKKTQHQSEAESEHDDDDDESDGVPKGKPKKRSKKKSKRTSKSKKKSKKTSDEVPNETSDNESDEEPKTPKKKTPKTRDGKADAPSDSKKTYRVSCLKNIWD